MLAYLMLTIGVGIVWIAQEYERRKEEERIDRIFNRIS